MSGFAYAVFEPQDLGSVRVIEPGEGKFKIVDAVEDAMSGNGNPMMTITFRIWDSNGQSTLYTMYLVKSTDPVISKATTTRIYNMLNSIDRLDLYGQPLKKMDILGHTGQCVIRTEVAKEAKFSDRSVIGKFIPHEKTADAIVRAQIKQLDDEIPF